MKTCAYKLGVDPKHLSAELDMLLLMEKGSKIDQCSNDYSNADEENKVLGTLLVQLPSALTGGKMKVHHGDDEWEGDDNDDDTEKTVSSFTLGASRASAYSCHFLCHYKDCEYSMDTIKSGSRIFLRFVLRYNVGEKAPTMNHIHDSIIPLKITMDLLRPADKMILIPLAKHYKEAVLLNSGINALIDTQRAYVEGIKAASDWKVLIVTAKLRHTYKEAYYGNIISSAKAYALEQIFDEEGNDITIQEEWLRSAVDFADNDDENDMLLSCDDEVWGNCISSNTTHLYDGDVSTHNDVHRATFLLGKTRCLCHCRCSIGMLQACVLTNQHAFAPPFCMNIAFDDTLSDVELKCLSGPGGVSEVTDIVVAKRNYDLLERLLEVVDSKEKSKFNLKSCAELLNMLVSSRSKKASSCIVNKVIAGLSSDFEPNPELYDSILLAVDKFGHDNVSTSISGLLSDEKRKKDIPNFLRRADFILKLNKRIQNGSRYLEKNITGIASIRGSHIYGNGAPINTTIDSMMLEHGTQAMEVVVGATLAFMHRNEATNRRNLTLLLNRAALLGKARGHQFSFVQQCITEFAVDFVSGLKTGSTTHAKQLMGGDMKRTFVRAFGFVMEGATSDDLCRFGEWALISEATFSTFLGSILSTSPTLLLMALNKTLVQNSTGYSGWWNHATRDASRMTTIIVPSLHIRKILIDFPDVVHKQDQVGRLPLHHAVNHKKTTYQTVMDIFEAYPRAVSVRDPISKLYPFMTAGSKGNIAASFDLLRADPSLIAGGISVAVEDTKKRKRSMPMKVE